MAILQTLIINNQLTKSQKSVSQKYIKPANILAVSPDDEPLLASSQLGVGQAGGAEQGVGQELLPVVDVDGEGAGLRGGLEEELLLPAGPAVAGLARLGLLAAGLVPD